MREEKAFTLIELLIVIAIIAILAAAVIISVNPGELLAKARDATRERHVKALESAVYTYHIDNLEFPTGITTTLTEICNTNIEGVACGELIDLSSLELASIPVDPQGGVDDNGTGYTVAIVDDRLLIDAQKAETRLVDININGLVGYWTFNDCEGDIAIDSSGYGNHGTLVSAPQWSTDTPPGGGCSLEFDGGETHIRIDHDESLVDAFGKTDLFTISTWINPSEWISHGAISKAPSGCWSHSTNTFWTYSGGFRCVMGDGNSSHCNPSGSYIVATHKPALNEWHHVACVGDGISLKLYVNGELKDDASISSITYERIDNTSPFIIGKRTATSTGAISGKVGVVRAYRKPLSQQEIQDIYSQIKHKYLAENE